MTSINPIRAGIDVTATDDIDIHGLGTEVMRGSTKYLYVRSAAALTQYYAYAIEDTFTVGAATKTSTIGNSPRLVGVPQITVATPSTGYTYRYFWIAVKGDMEVYVLNGCNSGIKLYTHTVDGQLTHIATGSLVQNIKLTESALSSSSYSAFALKDLQVG